jgi:hypothetical protein
MDPFWFGIILMVVGFFGIKGVHESALVFIMGLLFVIGGLILMAAL